MRIPSQFNQDSLYRRDNRQRDSGDGYRRVIRLIIGLALVIVVMRQASRPAMYQTFFDPSSVTAAAKQQGGDPSSPPPGAVQLASQLASESAGPTSEDALRPPTRVTPEDRAIASALVTQLLPTDQRQWTVALSRWQSGQSAQSVPSSIESILTQLSTMEGIRPEQRSAWQAMLQAFATSVSAFSESDPLGQDRLASGSQTESAGDSSIPSTQVLPQVTAMLVALDDASNARVVDGSVWRAGDFDSLYRFLDQAKGLPQEEVTTTGVLPLLQQPDVFRNQWVRIEGAVARTERIESQDNPYGITHYWQLWLRPDGGADRPMVAIVPTIPESVAAIGPASIKTEGPEIVVIGRFLKRLAYESGLGADLAPVIVGQITSAPLSERELERLSDTNTSDTKIPMWLPIVIACLIGLAAAALVMWRTSVSATRARALRASRRADPDSFLHDLGHAKPQNSSTDENL